MKTLKPLATRARAGAPRMPARAGTASDRNNRERLLRAATDSFAENGFEGTSLRAIADDAGVSFQLIAYYFGTKEELWAATVDYLFERYLETGKGLGFTPSGNLQEQFRNHLRLLLTDMLQRSQLRKIWIQEYLAGSERYENVIQPQIKHLFETLALPYYTEVVRLGIVKKYRPEEISLLFSSLIQNNVVYPYYVELGLGVPPGSPKGVERQIDLIFGILTAEQDPPADGAATVESAREPSAPEKLEPDTVDGAVVYAWERASDSEGNRATRLERENMHLKQLVGSLSLEKKLLLERLVDYEQADLDR
jgi:AcrR family transcriptional regulator